jgi:hypothetical protein
MLASVILVIAALVKQLVLAAPLSFAPVTGSRSTSRRSARFSRSRAGLNPFQKYVHMPTGSPRKQHQRAE